MNNRLNDRPERSTALELGVRQKRRIGVKKGGKEGGREGRWVSRQKEGRTKTPGPNPSWAVCSASVLEKLFELSQLHFLLFTNIWFQVCYKP